MQSAPRRRNCIPKSTPGVLQNALLTTPPSPRNAAPLVAADNGLATNVTMAATSSGVANRFKSDVGRADLKNSFSTVCALLPDFAAQSATKSPTPRERVGPGSTLLIVMPVPAVASANPRATAICAALVMP